MSFVSFMSFVVKMDLADLSGAFRSRRRPLEAPP